ncbi:NAD(P)(+)--arginine ADP-ribosyltransferase 2-like [Ammospiza maritima maritima]
MAPLAQTLALLAMAMATMGVNVILLDMAPNSFDDQYRGCGPAMKAALPALNRSEFQQNKKFAEVWVKAAAEWQSQWPPESPLSPDQATAIMAFATSDLSIVFTEAVLVAGRSSQEYRDNFHFKTLHFLLTDALQRLRCPNKCLDVFRGVRTDQFNVTLGEKVGFNQFTFSSPDRTVAQHYGTDTMFEVHTCHGADIQKFFFNQSEKEVLIPPFKTFVVTKVTREGKKVQIELCSTGNSSNYNCEWLRGGSLPRNSPHLGGLLLATVAMAVAIGTLQSTRPERSLWSWGPLWSSWSQRPPGPPEK